MERFRPAKPHYDCVQAVINRVQELEAEGRITGVMDDRGKARCSASVKILPAYIALFMADVR